jgi:hypothetical protein
VKTQLSPFLFLTFTTCHLDIQYPSASCHSVMRGGR